MNIHFLRILVANCENIFKPIDVSLEYQSCLDKLLTANSATFWLIFVYSISSLKKFKSFLWADVVDWAVNQYFTYTEAQNY